MESPGILFWHFPGLASPGKDYSSWKVLEICLTQAVKFSEFTLLEMYVDPKENWFWNHGNERFKVKFGVWKEN